MAIDSILGLSGQHRRLATRVMNLSPPPDFMVNFANDSIYLAEVRLVKING